MWRDGDGSCIDAGAFSISWGVNDLELDKHFADLTESETTESKALQLAWKLYGASRTFFPLPWLVAKGQGGDDNQGRKIPSYGVSVGMEAIMAKYVKDTEERLLHILDEAAVPVYKDALQELRGTLYKWLDRLNSDASQDDLWNNPSKADLSAAIEAIGIQLEDIKKSR
ncbi:MAG: hypothetical protein M1840_006334 [Geoglossum simile]|nr:MAG: hypothetical protein M1840_006334 [Geoglossum simile]